MTNKLENPTDLDKLDTVKRFFIYGTNELADRLQIMLSARFPLRFFGFFYDKQTEERHRYSQYSLRFWKEALELLKDGDFVFLVWRDPFIEKEFLNKGIRVGLAANIVNVYGTYETPTLLHFCKNFLTGGGHGLDIGANTGLTGAMISSFVDDITVFEPNPDLIGVIKATCEGVENLSIQQKAVFNKRGVVHIYPAGTNNSSMVPLSKCEGLEVESVTIDSYCEANRICPTFIKVDVEGVDAEVILGAKNTIIKHLPFLFLEHPNLNEKLYQTNSENILKALAFLKEHYELLAYPTLDSAYIGNQAATNSDQKVESSTIIIDYDSIGMPLEVFERTFGGKPTNIGAVPKRKLV